MQRITPHPSLSHARACTANGAAPLTAVSWSSPADRHIAEMSGHHYHSLAQSVSATTLAQLLSKLAAKHTHLGSAAADVAAPIARHILRRL